MHNRKNATILNVFSTVCLQIITLLSGFIIPKLILNAFGSEINGLVSSLTQFLNYISLLEGGVGSVILANLYKPLATNDTKRVSSIVAAANGFFKKLALLFLGYQIVLAIVYPFFVKSAFSWSYIASLTMILGISTFVQYYFALTWRLLLQADKKMFVAAVIQGTAVVLNTILTAIMIVLFPSIHLVKFAAGVAYFIQPLVLNRYIARHYEIDKAVSADANVLAQRWDGFGINVAAMVHTGTATAVLSVMMDLESVSVFSVYFLVVTGLKSLITSISAGLVPTIGNLYAKQEMESFHRLFNQYEMIMFFVSFFCFTVGGIAVPSFAMLYTKNITDANYYQPLLGAILMMAECIFCIREPYINMAYTAGHFRQVSKFAYIEAALNILLAVLCTWLWGIVGVAVALAASITFRTFAQVWYLKNEIIYRSPWLFVKKLLCFCVASLIGIILCNTFVQIQDISIVSWALYAVKIAIIVGGCLLLGSVAVGWDVWKNLLISLRKNFSDSK